MTSRERVLKALRKEKPDRVPYGEFGIQAGMFQRLLETPAARVLPPEYRGGRVQTRIEALDKALWFYIGFFSWLLNMI